MHPITPNTFRNGGEVDMMAYYGAGRKYMQGGFDGKKQGRLTLRQATDGYFELYVRWHGTGQEEVLYRSKDLLAAGRYSNDILKEYGLEPDKYEID